MLLSPWGWWCVKDVDGREADLHRFCERPNYPNYFQVIKSISASSTQKKKRKPELASVDDNAWSWLAWGWRCLSFMDAGSVVQLSEVDPMMRHHEVCVRALQERKHTPIKSSGAWRSRAERWHTGCDSLWRIMNNVIQEGRSASSLKALEFDSFNVYLWTNHRSTGHFSQVIQSHNYSSNVKMSRNSLI